MNNKFHIITRAAQIIVVLAAVVILVFFIIIHPDLSATGREDSRLIGVSYMTMNNEFYRVMHEQISARIEVEGDRILLRNPALDAERQIAEIEEMMDAGIDGLILTPVELGGMANVLRKARKKGIRIVIADTNVADEDLVDCSVVSDNYHAGELIGEYFLKKHDSARVVLVKHEATASGRDRVRGFLDKISVNPEIRVVYEMDGEGQIERVMPLMQEFIRSGEPFDSVFCLNDPSAIGVVAALEASGRQADGDGADPEGEDGADAVRSGEEAARPSGFSGIDIYGVDGSPDAKNLILEGKIEATVAQYPSKIGAESADALYRLLEGEETETFISVPVQLVTAGNVSLYQPDRWL